MRDVDCYRQSFSVPYTYPVYFTHGVFSPESPILQSVLRDAHEDRPVRVVAYVDDGLADANPGVIDSLTSYLSRDRNIAELLLEPQTVAGGERAKNGWDVVREIMRTIGNHHVCRHSVVLAVGGGSVLDMVGFAASIVHRGVRLVRIPSTVLAQCDGGVGVKNGMDEHGMKNFVGTFAPPFAVVNDFDLLKTLPDTYWIGGISEAFKVAIIKDMAFFDMLCDHASALRNRDHNAIEKVVHRTAILHLEHIATQGDPFEFGTSRPLDFGHWAAHKLEVLSNYDLNHGQAVAVGIALDSCYAAAAGLITGEDRDRILDAFDAVGLPSWTPLLREKTEDGTLSVLQGLDEFREHLGGRLTVTLPDGIGNRVEVHEMNPDHIKAGLELLESRYGI